MNTLRNILGIFIAAIFLATSLFVGTGFSQSSYPDKPVKIITWTNTGTGDVIRRTHCLEAEKELGQPIVWEYITGASGTLMMNSLAKAKPDGYTLGTVATSVLLVGPQIRKTSYNTLTDFVDIIAIAKYTFALAVRSDAPWKTYEELLEWSKKNPGKFRYTCVGVGVTQHIAMEQIAEREGVKWTLVPFKTTGECMTATLGGHVDAIVQGPIDIVPQVQANKFKMLLVVGGKRWDVAPNVPNLTDKGYDFVVDSFISYNGPKGLPEPIRQKLENAFRKATKSSSYVQLLNKFGMEISDMGGKEFSALWKARYEQLGKTVKQLGLNEN
jgi:tripartite-type tricarboxylate transporter receptor subunit TctC